PGDSPNQRDGNRVQRSDIRPAQIHRLIAHHTLHAFSRTIGAFWPQWKARWNSGMFETMPLMRYLPGECGLVMAFARRFSGVWALQAHCANPMKKRWSGVKPSIGWLSFASAAFQAM